MTPSPEAKDPAISAYLNDYHRHIQELWLESTTTEFFPALDKEKAERTAFDLLSLLQKKVALWTIDKSDTTNDGAVVKTFNTSFVNDDDKTWLTVQIGYMGEKVVSGTAMIVSRDPMFWLMEELAQMSLKEAPYLRYRLGPCRDEKVAKVQWDNTAAPSMIEALIQKLPIEN